MIFDIDGVLTDGKVLVMENGEMVRNMYSKDGYALHLALEKSYRIVIISGGNNIAVRTALSRAGVKDIFINVKDKLQCFKEYIQKNKFTEAEKELKEACAIIPEVSFYMTLAELFRKQNRTLESKQQLDVILAMLNDDTKQGHNMSLEYAKFYLEY